MTTLYIEEYRTIGTGINAEQAQVPNGFINVQNVTISATSTQSLATNTNTRFIRLIAINACHYAVGDNPTASSSDRYLPAGTVIDLQIDGGNKVAVIEA